MQRLAPAAAPRATPPSLPPSLPPRTLATAGLPTHGHYGEQHGQSHEVTVGGPTLVLNTDVSFWNKTTEGK